MGYLVSRTLVEPVGVVLSVGFCFGLTGACRWNSLGTQKNMSTLPGAPSDVDREETPLYLFRGKTRAKIHYAIVREPTHSLASNYRSCHPSPAPTSRTRLCVFIATPRTHLRTPTPTPRQGHAGMAKRLLGAGASANLPNMLGQTPLMYAANFGTEELVLMLLEALKPGGRKDVDSQGR